MAALAVVIVSSEYLAAQQGPGFSVVGNGFASLSGAHERPQASHLMGLEDWGGLGHYAFPCIMALRLY